MNTNIYRKPDHIEVHSAAVRESCPFCDSKSFSRSKPCQDCGIVLPSARSEKPIALKDRRRVPADNEDDVQEENYIDDHSDDDLDDGLLMPPTTEEIESLPWDDLDQYIPATTQENEE
jgi:hypothetical protein